MWRIFQKSVDFIRKNLHFLNQRFNKIAVSIYRMFQILSSPQNLLGQFGAIRQNSLPPADRNRQTIAFHLSFLHKKVLRVFIATCDTLRRESDKQWLNSRSFWF